MAMERKETPKGFSSESRFSVEAFSLPTIDYAPIYTWMWNGEIKEQETDRQLAEMQRLGIRRMYILPMPKSFRPTSFPTPLDPAYLSEEYLRAYRYAVDRAHTLGMDVWIYDEGGWPSGGACGQVVLEDPSLVQETLRVQTRTLEQGEVYLAAEGAEAAFLDGKRIRHKDRAIHSGVVTEYLRVKTSFPKVNSADLPDITKEGTTPLFLSLTHDKYAASLGESLSGISALFTDEPTAPRPFPYTDEIKTLFRERFHRDIEDALPFLMGNVKCTKEWGKIKIDFYRMLSDLYLDRFLKKEKAWANAHSLAYVGHLDKDDEPDAALTSGCFDLLRALRVFDVPGVDAIRRQIFPPKGKKGKYGENSFYPILASSAAAQSGGRHALSESFAVYGAGLSYDEMRYVIDYQAMCGINVYNPMLIPYARNGYALAGELPHFTEKTYPELADFNRYLERVSYLFSLGERVARVALYLPVADGILGEDSALASYKALGKALQERGVPFDIVDDDFFTFATVANGCITACRASYDTILLPDITYLPEESAVALAYFTEMGGKVLTPSLSLTTKISGATLLTEENYPTSPLPLLSKDILFAESRTEDEKMYFLMNKGGYAQTISFTPPFDCYAITPTDGAIHFLRQGRAEWPLASGEILCLLSTDRKLDAKEFSLCENEIELTNWTFRATERLVIEDTCRILSLSKESTPILLGDWASRLGVGFSGKGEYRTTFSLPYKVQGAVIDLGKAAHATEILLNGTSLGIKLMPPYRYEISPSLLKEENELVVYVRNGIANEFEATEAFDKYYPWQLGNYIKEERIFHTDSLESGLFGAVKLYYK